MLRLCCATQVEHTDILWLAVILFTTAALATADGLLTKFELKKVGEDRQYTELNTGQWWEKTEAEVAEKALVLRFAAFMLRFGCVYAAKRSFVSYMACFCPCRRGTLRFAAFMLRLCCVYVAFMLRNAASSAT